MGSLLTAVASYLDARQHGGQWLVRIDDLDQPRTVPGATDAILAALHAHELVPDGPVDYQSSHHSQYAAAADKLSDDLFFCTCTRAQLRGLNVYPGICREARHPADDAAVRLRAKAERFVLHDELQGARDIDTVRDVGDLIVRRRDGPWAYNFATAIDDGGVYDRVVRGADLLDVTAAQVAIMHRLGLQPPVYAHVPVLSFPDGRKLSKQNRAVPLDNHRATDNVAYVLSQLGLDTRSAKAQTPGEWLRWALPRFTLSGVPQRLEPFPRTEPPD